jgi:hypothetical protein
MLSGVISRAMRWKMVLADNRATKRKVEPLEYDST